MCAIVCLRYFDQFNLLQFLTVATGGRYKPYDPTSNKAWRQVEVAVGS